MTATIDTPIGQNRRTNKDSKPRRRYTLSAEGLAALRASAARNRPWESSTGPKTVAGKSVSRMNALKHGDRSVEGVALWRLAKMYLRSDTDELRLWSVRHERRRRHLRPYARAVMESIALMTASVPEEVDWDRCWRWCCESGLWPDCDFEVSDPVDGPTSG
ncbi:MAG: hypothetical protein ACTS3F_10740 [Phycisphaerales bacterium]